MVLRSFRRNSGLLANFFNTEKTVNRLVAFFKLLLSRINF